MGTNSYMGRKLKTVRLQEKPAVIVTAFGSSKSSGFALNDLEEKIREALPDYELFWAFTSSIIRKKTGTSSLQQTLAQVQEQGFRKVVIQPVQIFPGSEYSEIIEIADMFPGLRVLVGETLMHRWQFVREILNVIEEDFAAPGEGINLLAMHGTSLTGDSANSAYLGVDRFVKDVYENVLTASLEGVPDGQGVIQKIKRKKRLNHPGKVRIIPLMYLAGIHVQNDLMGETGSWKSELEESGFEVSCPTAEIEGETSFKSLACYSEIQLFFIDRLKRTIELLSYY